MVEQLDPGEVIEAWGAAKWRENPYAESVEDSEGVLYLTTRRIVFQTDQVQPFVSLDLNGFETVEITARRRGESIQLVFVHVDGELKSFWCDVDLADRVAAAIDPSSAL